MVRIERYFVKVTLNLVIRDLMRNLIEMQRTAIIKQPAAKDFDFGHALLGA